MFVRSVPLPHRHPLSTHRRFGPLSSTHLEAHSLTFYSTVWIKRGICSADSLINIGLCCLGFLPGLVHAWYIIAKYPDLEYSALEQDPEGAHVTYYYVDRRGADGSQRLQQPHSQPQHGYGTNTPMPAPQNTNGEGRSGGGVPPSYEQAVRGDHKVQTNE